MKREYITFPFLPCLIHFCLGPRPPTPLPVVSLILNAQSHRVSPPFPSFPPTSPHDFSFTPAPLDIFNQPAPMKLSLSLAPPLSYSLFFFPSPLSSTRSTPRVKHVKQLENEQQRRLFINNKIWELGDLLPNIPAKARFDKAGNKKPLTKILILGRAIDFVQYAKSNFPAILQHYKHEMDIEQMEEDDSKGDSSSSVVGEQRQRGLDLGHDVPTQQQQQQQQQPQKAKKKTNRSKVPSTPTQPPVAVPSVFPFPQLGSPPHLPFSETLLSRNQASAGTTEEMEEMERGARETTLKKARKSVELLRVGSDREIPRVSGGPKVASESCSPSPSIPQSQHTRPSPSSSLSPSPYPNVRAPRRSASLAVLGDQYRIEAAPRSTPMNTQDIPPWMTMDATTTCKMCRIWEETRWLSVSTIESVLIFDCFPFIFGISYFLQLQRLAGLLHTGNPWKRWTSHLNIVSGPALRSADLAARRRAMITAEWELTHREEEGEEEEW